MTLMNCDLNKYGQDCDYKGKGEKKPFTKQLFYARLKVSILFNFFIRVILSSIIHY